MNSINPWIAAGTALAALLGSIEPSAAAGAAPAQPASEQEPSGAITLPAGSPSEVGDAKGERWVEFNGQRRLVGVSQATLTPVLPPPGRATGAAIVVAPGGGFVQLAMDKEGWNAARWLADHGIAAFVLKYRLRAFPPAAGSRSAALANPGAYPPALADAEAAMRLVIARAGEWGVDSKRVGMMGFSAGAVLSLAIGTDADAAVRPAFIASVYGPMANSDMPNDAPPLFSAIALDDQTVDPTNLATVFAWRAAHRPVELHLYAKGGHGFGVPGIPGTTTTGLMDELLLWLRSIGVLEAQPAGH